MKCPCNKHLHLAKAQAESQLRSLVSKSGYAGEVYRCPHFDGWHVGRAKANARRNPYR